MTRASQTTIRSARPPAASGAASSFPTTSGTTFDLEASHRGNLVGRAERHAASVRRRGMSWALTVTSRTDPPRTVGAQVHHQPVTDDESTPMTVRDRLTAAGLSDERIEQHMTAGRVRVDGELVTDLDAPAPVGTRVVVSTG